MPQVGRVVAAHAGSTLHHRLEHHAGQRVDVLDDRTLERLEGAVVIPGLPGRRHLDALEQHALERLAKDLDAAQRRRAQGLAVEGFFQRNEPLAFRSTVLGPVLEAQLDGHFDRGGAVVAEEDVLEAPGRDRAQGFGQLAGVLVGNARQRRVTQGLGLAL